MDAGHAGALADLLLVVHFSVVLFVVCGLVLTFMGGLRGWAWVRRPGFRLAHLLLVGFIVVQAHLGEWCPLTVWERDLRRLAGRSSHEEGFIEHWVSRLVYYDFPDWVFLLVYTAFGVLVVASWIWVRPRWRC